MEQYGLIGYPLSHSFSKKYFTEKFQKEHIEAQYNNFEIEHISQLRELLHSLPINGLNVTIPHKTTVLPLLDDCDELAQRIGAVNTIKVLSNNSLKGYNSDYFGFKTSLQNWQDFKEKSPKKSLILGDGGAAKAIKVALEDLGIDYKSVGRTLKKNELLYTDLTEEWMQEHTLIINTTPLGTFPAIENYPNIPYNFLNSTHLLYDLVYNPSETIFLKRGKMQKTSIKNGLEMLTLQAEKAYEIWTKS